MREVEFTATTWEQVRPGDRIRVTRRGYGRREGVLGEFRRQENGDWVWPDRDGGALLDPWWAGEGFVEVERTAPDV